MKKILIISSIAVAISFFNISCSNDFESSPMEVVLEEENRTESNSLIDEKARFISSSSSNGNNRRASLSSIGIISGTSVPIPGVGTVSGGVVGAVVGGVTSGIIAANSGNISIGI